MEERKRKVNVLDMIDNEEQREKAEDIIKLVIGVVIISILLVVCVNLLN